MNTVANSVKPKCRPLFSFSNNTKRSYSAKSEKKPKCGKTNLSKSVSSHNVPEESKFPLVTKMAYLNTKVKSSKLKSKSPKENSSEVCSASNIQIKKEKGHRINDLNIQMLSKELYKQIYRENAAPNQSNAELIKKAQMILKQHGLWKEDIEYLEDVSLDLPPLSGKNIEEHFWNIGTEQSEPYKKLLLSFAKTGIPRAPKTWINRKGWTKYVSGEEPISVPFPDEDTFVFDVEVCMKLGELPTLATAVSSTAWYGWVCSDLADGINSLPTNYYKTDKLIPFEGDSISKERPRIIIGHNVSFDRSKIKEQYYINNSGLRFLDTMSLHICIGGYTRHQKVLLKSKTEETDAEGWGQNCLTSLKDLYYLYCNKELSKEKRNIFMDGQLSEIRNNFQSMMEYCSNDVKATFEVFQAIFDVFLNRCPHPVTLAGMLEMSTAFLPVNSNWNKFLTDADQTFDDLKNEVSFLLSKKSDNACRLFHNEEYKNDLWMWSEDWSTSELKLTKKKLKEKSAEEENKPSTISNEEEDPLEEELTKKFQYLFDLKEILPVRRPFLPGYPMWYRKLCDRPNSEDWSPHPKLTTSLLITPKLLNLTWDNFPLFHTREFGWGILVADIYIENYLTDMPFEKLKELTFKNCKIDLDYLDKENLSVVKKRKKCRAFNNFSPAPYYKGSGIWCDHTVEGCCYFFKLPHKDGGSKNVGTPLAKDFTQILMSNTLKGTDFVAGRVMDLGKQLSYWRNNRERITDQMIVWLNKNETPTDGDRDNEIPCGVILPKVVVCGTVTRRAMEATWLTASKVTEGRIGSELRAMVQAPPGYHFIGADVDSQELWIASLIGDSYFAKEHGCTPLGWMTLSGTKTNEKDMHSITAKSVGISRNEAKIINYSRIYGAGVKFAQKLLQQFNPEMSVEEAKEKAVKMYKLTKGKKVYKLKSDLDEDLKDSLGLETEVYDLGTAIRVASCLGKELGDIFEKPYWTDGTESAMFNKLEQMASSSRAVTPFLQARLSSTLEQKFSGDNYYMNTRINWVVQSGAVDFLHLMLVCMRWLTNGRARYCFSFHDEVRYLIPSEIRYNGALAVHITNLLVRAFCAYRLGIYDLPQSVAFFSAVDIDKSLRKEANDECITPSNPHGMAKGYGIGPGESLNIYGTIKKAKGSLAPFGIGQKSATKRKHVHREVLQGELVPPEGHQQIVRVLGSRGNNLHEVETPDLSAFLVSMPNKFRKNVWIKKGDYILVEPIEEGEKVKAEMVKVLTPDYIKYLKKENIWPNEFDKNQNQDSRDGDDDKDIDSDLIRNRNHVVDESESSDETD